MRTKVRIPLVKIIRWLAWTLCAVSIAQGTSRLGDTVSFQKRYKHSAIPFRLQYLGTPKVYDVAERRDSSSLRDLRMMPGKNASIDVSRGIQISTAASETAKVLWARQFASGLVPSSDYPNAICADSAGNVYVAGVSDQTYSDGNIVVAKYNARGNFKWDARYSNPSHGYSEAFAITVDLAGNVFITGYTLNQGSGVDMVTVKFDSSGGTQWVRGFQGDGDSTDVGTDVKVDRDGNSYVLGYTYRLGSDFDIVLISYSPSGDERWRKYYDGSAHAADYPAGLSIGKNGAVCMTGSTIGASTGEDIITAEYDSGGYEEWQNSYATPIQDYSIGIVCDDSGFVTVTGYTGALNSPTTFLLIQYTPQGEQRWSSTYAGANSGTKRPTGISMFGSDGICVTGIVQSSGSINYLTVMVDHSTGTILWESLYDNPSHGDDYAVGVAVSTEHRIYVTGYSRFDASSAFAFLTVEYDSTGKEILADRFVPNSNDAFPVAIVPDRNDDVFICGAIIGNSFDIQVIKYSLYQQGEVTAVLDLGSMSDQVGGMVNDPHGNVYVFGSSGQAMNLVKFNSSLNRLWALSIPDLSDCSAIGLTLDSVQNIFVTGSTRSTRGDLDILTAKISSDGVLEWTQLYNGPDSTDDEPVALVSDGNGDIIITGESYSATTMEDIVTIEYSPAGSLEWTARYNNFFNHDDVPASIALDKEQNIYVTGYTVRWNTSYDIITIKYDQSGGQQWIRYYNGPGSGADYGKVIAIDAHDTIYVAGKSYGGQTSSNVVLLKYTTDGTLEWTARYTGVEQGDQEPTSMIIDPNNNPVIAGMTYHTISSFDFLTLKYNTDGSLLWKSEYDDLNHGIDEATALASDWAGNIYVTGTSLASGTGNNIVTIKYSPSGGLQWLRSYNGNASLDDFAGTVTVDSNGNVFACGTTYDPSSGFDIVVIKYLFPPLESWPVRYDGPGTSGDGVSAVSTDQEGSVYVAGQSEYANSSMYYTALKYDQSGNQVWNSYYTAAFNSLAVARDMVLTSDGSPVITGYYQEGGGTAYNYLTIQYSPGGIPRWAETFAPLGGSYNFATDIALSPLQSVYVSGYSYTSTTSYDYCLVKYSSTGEFQWSMQYNDTANDNDISTAMIVDQSENTYVTGASGNGRRSSSFATVKVDPNGLTKWIAIYDGPDHLDDRASAIAIDSSRNVIVTGWSMSNSTEHDFATVKYDPAGEQIWAVRYDGAGSRDDPASVAVDPYGFIYVAGTSYHGGFVNPDFVLVKYDSSGEVVWSRTFDGGSNRDDILKKMTLDVHGNIYVTGKCTNPDGVSDMVTLKYDSSGSIRWIARYHDPSNFSSEPYSMTLAKDGDVVVTGTTSGTRWSVITTIDYQQGPESGVGPEAGFPARFALFQNHPNPFNNSTILTYSLAGRAHVQLEIYNLLGQKLASLVDRTQEAGRYNVPFLANSIPSGTYFYRLNVVKANPRIGEERVIDEVRKMILLK